MHLSHIGHPVVGDETYGGGKRRARNVKSAPARDLLLDTQRQMLHAVRLEFTIRSAESPFVQTRLCLRISESFGEKSKMSNWQLNHPFHIAAGSTLISCPICMGSSSIYFS
jgi:23S rRNA-/tRNA-specific pseudouridylate synthase